MIVASVLVVGVAAIIAVYLFRGSLGIPKQQLTSVLDRVEILVRGSADEQPSRATDDIVPELVPQTGHTLRIHSVAFSPSGDVVASGSRDDTVKLWSVSSGRLLRTIAGHKDAVDCVVFSPDGRMVASASWDATVRLWNVATGRELGILRGHSPSVRSVAFSPNGQSLVTAGDESIELWDVATSRLVRTFGRPSGIVWSVRFSPDGRTIASGGADDAITVWNVASGRAVSVMRGHSSWVRSVAFSSDGRILASGGDDGVAKLWNVASGQELRTLAGHSGPVLSVAFSPDNRTLATGSSDHAIKLWQVESGHEIGTLRGHPNEVYSVAFSPNGKILASGGEDHSVRIWNARTGRQLASLSGYVSAVTAVTFISGGRGLVTEDQGQVVRSWDTRTGREISRTHGTDVEETTSDTENGNPTGLPPVAFSRDGRTVALGHPGEVEVVDAASGSTIDTLRLPTKRTYAVALSSDARTIAAASENNDLVVWDRTSRHVAPIPEDTSIFALAFSRDGHTLAGARADGGISLWDTRDGRKLRDLVGKSSGALSLAFSPTDTTLASAGADGNITLWDAASGREQRTLTGHHGWVVSLAFSPDGHILASGSGDNSIKLWNVANGHERATLVGHSGWISSIAFSPDGRTLITGCVDGTTRVWDVASGRQRVALIGFNDGSSLAVTPQGFFDSSSEQAEEDLNVSIGTRAFGISSFRDNFYRPDLVQKALAGDDISQQGSIDKVKLSPDVAFVGLPPNTNDFNLWVTLHLANVGGGFGPIRVYRNNTAVHQYNDVPPAGVTLTRSYLVPLVGGNNDLRVSAFNADGTMWSEAHGSVRLPMPAKLASAHGTLHALLFGIQTFPNAAQHNLKYSAVDAELVASTLKQYSRPLFDKLDVQLFDTTATTDKASMVSALREMQSAGPYDEFIFYVSSHGIVFDNEYYIATSDLDPLGRLAAHSLSATELRALLANIGAGRKLVILDTCDAEVAREKLVQRSATVLGRDDGFTILAAASADQDALEGGFNNHGLFTYVVNDGLSGQGTAAIDQSSGIVTSFLLASYVKQQVPLVAQAVLKHVQQPTVEPSGQSFSVTKVR